MSKRDKNKKKKSKGKPKSSLDKWKDSRKKKKRNNCSKDSMKRGYNNYGKHSTTTSDKKKKHKSKKLLQIQPPPDENLGDIVLVKDENMKQKKMKIDPVTGISSIKSKENLLSKQGSVTGFIYHSVESMNPNKKVATQMSTTLNPFDPSLPQMEASMERMNLNFKDEDKQKIEKNNNESKGNLSKIINVHEEEDEDIPIPIGSSPKNNEAKENAMEGNEDRTKRDEPEEKKECLLTTEEKKKKWKSYMENILDGGMETITKEFNQVKGYLPTAATRGANDAHPRDNRFEDIVCIDHTRVLINDQKSYLHANWVEMEKERKMILTQLPLPHTASNFWQMILERNVQAILLFLTNYEFDTFHAEMTFPDQQDFLHYEDRHIRVGEFKQIKVASQWTMHVLSITNGDQKRYLHLHHYRGWSHGQELKNYTDLLRIQSTFKKYRDPHVIMSLSGCGRAGTYAAFEIAHNRLHSDTIEKMNVVEVVRHVRNGRMHAVQRASQLKTIHMALLDHVLSNGFITEMSSRQKDAWEELKKPNDE